MLLCSFLFFRFWQQLWKWLHCLDGSSFHPGSSPSSWFQQWQCGCSSMESASAEWPTPWLQCLLNATLFHGDNVVHGTAANVFCNLEIPAPSFFPVAVFPSYSKSFLITSSSLSGFISSGLLKLVPYIKFLLFIFLVISCLTHKNYQGRWLFIGRKSFSHFFSQKFQEEGSMRNENNKQIRYFPLQLTKHYLVDHKIRSLFYYCFPWVKTHFHI